MKPVSIADLWEALEDSMRMCAKLRGERLSHNNYQ